jgi:hypothetical protein
MGFFRRSDLWTQCEECKQTVDLSRAGVCGQCRRVLCHRHLHGSFARRLMVDLGADPLCLRCRRQA